MRIVKDPDERKQEILNAAIRVFARKGYEKTSISDIAKEIGVSQGLCYRYFPSKEAMYEAAIDEYASYIATANVRMTPTEGLTLKEQILMMSSKMKDYTHSEHEMGDLYELFHKQENKRLHNELMVKVGEKLVSYVENLLQAAKERGEIQIADPKVTAYFSVFGQVGILMSDEFTEEEKMGKIKKCLLEMTNL